MGSCLHCVQTAAAAPHAACGWAPSADPLAKPPSLLLGVLASDARLAVRALRDFCAALGAKFLLPEPDVRPLWHQRHHFKMLASSRLLTMGLADSLQLHVCHARVKRAPLESTALYSWV